MPRHNPLEPWLHQSSGYWCKKVQGKLEYLDRDYTVAKRKLKKLLAELAAGKSNTSEWLDAPLSSLCDEFLEDIKLRKPFATFEGYKYRLLRALKVLESNFRVGAVILTVSIFLHTTPIWELSYTERFDYPAFDRNAFQFIGTFRQS